MNVKASFDLSRSRGMQAMPRVAALMAILAQPGWCKPFVVSNDGLEVQDQATGLIWRRCVEGETWNGTTCAGSAYFLTWYEALQRADAQARESGFAWRMPNVKELASLVDTARQNPTIDPATFPNSPNDELWSSTPFAQDAFYGWVVHFTFGATYWTYLEQSAAARLVRSP